MGKKETYNYSAFKTKEEPVVSDTLQEKGRYDYSAFGEKKKKRGSGDVSQVSSEEALPSPSPVEADPVGEAILSEEPFKNPILKAAAEKSSWFAAPINWLRSLVSFGGSVMKDLDGGQRMFYRGVGSLMEASGNPSVAVKGTVLKVQQDTQKTWFKKAEEGVDAYKKNRLPPRIGASAEEYTDPKTGEVSIIPASLYKKSILSDLLYSSGEVAGLITTLLVTPELKLFGLSQKLAVNFFAINTLQTYSETGKLGESLVAGSMGVGDALMFKTMGLGSQVLRGGTTKLMSNVLGPKVANTFGATTAGGFMFSSGYAHSIARQIVDNPNWEWNDEAKDQAMVSGLTFFALEAPNILGAATSTYQKAPKEAIEAARKIEVTPEQLRKQTKDLMDEVTLEMGSREVGERAIAASLSDKTASIKAVDKFLGEHPEESIKRVKESDISDTEKSVMIAKIEDAALNVEYQKQLELTKDLGKAEETLKEAPEKPVEGISPPSEGKVPLEGEKPSEGLKRMPIEKVGDKWVIEWEGEKKEFYSEQAAKDFIMLSEAEKGGKFDVMTEGMITEKEKSEQTRLIKEEKLKEKEDAIQKPIFKDLDVDMIKKIAEGENILRSLEKEGLIKLKGDC